jgi:hypothetical protein
MITWVKKSINYSFLIAASGLSLIALSDGINPATIPTTIAKATATGLSHSGIRQMAPVIPIESPMPLEPISEFIINAKR